MTPRNFYEVDLTIISQFQYKHETRTWENFFDQHPLVSVSSDQAFQTHTRFFKRRQRSLTDQRRLFIMKRETETWYVWRTVLMIMTKIYQPFRKTWPLGFRFRFHFLSIWNVVHIRQRVHGVFNTNFKIMFKQNSNPNSVVTFPATSEVKIITTQLK
jgi:hypothetical protein